MCCLNKYLIIIVLSVFIIPIVHAQFNETIRTGRPGEAIGPFAVGKNVLQIQSGLDFGGSQTSLNDTKSNNRVFGTVFRFGMTKHFELNSAWTLRNDHFTGKNTDLTTKGLGSATLGTRINIYEGGNNKPAVGLQMSFNLPIAADAYKPKYIAPKFVIIANKKLSDKWTAFINGGGNWNGKDAIPNGIYVLNLSYTINAKWGAFIENYGSFTANSFNKNWDTGLAYSLNDNLQFDIYGGLSKNNNKLEYFTSTGISWRTLSFRQSPKIPKN